MMEEYEVRDVSRRSESPDLDLDLKIWDSGNAGEIFLEPFVMNRSAEPVLYATCRLYIEQGLNFVLHPNWRWSTIEDTELIWHDRDKAHFHTARHAWSVPERHPILEGERYAFDRIRVSVGINFKQISETQRYNIGWELRAPKSAAKLKGLKLAVDRNGPRIEAQTYSLRPV